MIVCTVFCFQLWDPSSLSQGFALGDLSYPVASSSLKILNAKFQK